MQQSQPLHRSGGGPKLRMLSDTIAGRVAVAASARLRISIERGSKALGFLPRKTLFSAPTRGHPGMPVQNVRPLPNRTPKGEDNYVQREIYVHSNCDWCVCMRAYNRAGRQFNVGGNLLKRKPEWRFWIQSRKARRRIRGESCCGAFDLRRTREHHKRVVDMGDQRRDRHVRDHYRQVFRLQELHWHVNVGLASGQPADTVGQVTLDGNGGISGARDLYDERRCHQTPSNGQLYGNSTAPVLGELHPRTARRATSIRLW